VLASRPLAGPASADEPRPAARSGLRTEVRLEVSAAAQGAVRSEVSLAGTVLSAREARLPADVWQVWQGLRAAPVAAAQRMLSVGRQLAGALFDEPSQRRVADLMAGMPAGDWVDVVLVGDGAVAGLPVELLRLTGSDGAELGPLALLGGVTVSRRLGGPGAPAAGRLPGPVKVLAAVAAPQETLTASLPLDVEAEMHAVLNAVGGLAGGGDGQPAGQVRILEVASLAQITGALRGRDRYHVLHLSAHGSPTSVELEDEDGRPVEVSTQRLVSALRDAGVRLPLIVLSSCHGGSASAQAMAAGLVRAGASRVIAMQTSVTDDYATALTAALYQELASRPDQPVAQALALARRRAEDRPRDQAHAAPPEYGVATLLSAGADGPLVDVHAAPAPLTAPTAMPSGATVRELRLGELIGRRRELRAATAVLRRAAAAVDEHGAIAGVQLLGIGGIGKTALAGRVIGRLRDDGWTVVVHEGRWDPAALFATIAEQVRCLPDAAREAAALASADVADTAKVGLVASLLAAARLLLVFDDFEQNLTPGGAAFADPNLDAVLTEWCDKAERGGLLLTCRYPLPGADRYLVPIQVPPLSASELRRMFLRLPALRALPDEDRRLLSRIIGGHPRLIEYVDALLRGKPARLKQVQAKLRRLAADQGVDLRKPRPLGTAIDQALLLGSADILLEELLGLLTDAQAAIVHQLSVCRAPMTLDDLAYTLELPEDDAARAAQLATDVERLTDLTLLTAGPDVLLHGWTAELLSRRGNGDTTRLHERALATRLRRLQQGRADQLDLLDLARHLAALHQYDEVADLATQAVAVLPGSLAAAAFLADIRALLPSSHRSWIQVTKEEYEAVKAAGNLSQAEALLTAMRQEIDSQTAASPADMFWQSWLSVVIVDLADLATARGDLAGVQKNLTRAHSQATQFASAYVDNHWWQNHSALIRNRLGNVAVAVGDLVGAGEHYQASLTVDEGLVAADPTNTRWRRGVSVSREKLGDVAVAVGDLLGAREHYQASLAIRERLVAVDPTNVQWQRDLAYVRQRLTDLDGV
jgi:hypothetical protein